MAYPKFNIKTAAENFKGQLRSTEHQARDAQEYARQFAGISGAQELKWAADTVAEAVKKAQGYLERVIRY